MKNPVVHFEISGKDGNQLHDFYRSVFDWNVEVQPEMGNYGMVSPKSGENQIGGGVFQSPDGKPGITFYIMVDDLQKYLDKAGKHGGKTLVPPTKIADQIGHFAMFVDPAGNALGLFKPAAR